MIDNFLGHLQATFCYFCQFFFANFYPSLNFLKPRLRLFFSETKFSDTKTETFLTRPNFQIPIPRLFFRDQIFRYRDRDFFSETKFSDTDTETTKKIAKVSRPGSLETEMSNSGGGSKARGPRQTFSFVIAPLTTNKQTNYWAQILELNKSANCTFCEKQPLVGWPLVEQALVGFSFFSLSLIHI